MKKEVILTVKEEFMGEEKERNFRILEILLEILKGDMGRWQP